ncbi:MAG: nicotinate-nucleotide adenylyltransferase [Deltaproteobacteria bacterium]|nr:nicotinate-nucleotide adenylyltransferase [Deltaproteobacteria bacterium]
MHSVGVIHGRFQVLHNDHLRYLLEGKARCDHLVAGITNPDPILSREDEADPARSALFANPLTYFERYQLVVAALIDEGVVSHEFSVVPFPINFPELYRYYVPMEAPFFITICDRWGERKHELLTGQGLKVEVMWRRTPDTKGLTGSEIRHRMALGEPWQHLVPPSTARLLVKWNIVDRLQELALIPQA